MISFCVRKGIYIGIDVLYNECRSEACIFYFLHKIFMQIQKEEKSFHGCTKTTQKRKEVSVAEAMPHGNP